MIRINPLFLFVLFLAWHFDLLTAFLLVFSVAVLHEAGHALCARLFGLKIKLFQIQPWGVCMKTEPFLSPASEIAVAAAGPFVNLLLLGIGFIKPNPLFLLSNMFMLLINLLPVYPLDGGRIFYCLVLRETDRECAKKIIRIVSGIVTVIVFIAGGVLLYKTKVNFSVLLAAAFMAFSADSAEENESYKCAMPPRTRHYLVCGTDSVRIALKVRRGSNAVVFDVTDSAHRYLGSVTLREVMEQIAKFGYDMKFNEILRK